MRDRLKERNKCACMRACCACFQTTLTLYPPTLSRRLPHWHRVDGRWHDAVHTWADVLRHYGDIGARVPIAARESRGCDLGGQSQEPRQGCCPSQGTLVDRLGLMALIFVPSTALDYSTQLGTNPHLSISHALSRLPPPLSLYSHTLFSCSPSLLL